MIPGEDLRLWLEDRSAQRATRDAADAFARRWNDGPVHHRFATATASLEGHSAESVAAAAAALLNDDSWIDPLLSQLAQSAGDDPYFEPPFRHLGSDIHTGLVLFEDEYLSVAAGVGRITDMAARKNGARGKTSVAFSGHVGVFRFVKAGGARLSFWEAPRITAGFRAQAAGKCVRTGERSLDDGETLIVDGRYRSFVIEQARSNFLLLQATVKADQAPLSVEYDSESGEYVGCSAADDSASRIQMIATLLRKLGCGAAFPAIAAFLDHPNFFVRWHVMRELLGLDAQAALPHLKRMAARDPHPEARQAARATLDYIESGPAKAKAA